MKSRQETSSLLPLASALICFTYNALTVSLCMHLPNDPFHLASYIHMYSLAGCLFSILGVYAILTKRTSIVKAYSQFLLIDAFVSVICRMLLEEFFIESLYEINVCGNTFDDEHWSNLNPGYAIMTRTRWESKFKRMFDSSESCNVALAALHFVAVGAMILSSVAQVSLAVLMQRFGKQLEISNRYRLWTIVEVDEKLDLEFQDAAIVNLRTHFAKHTPITYRKVDKSQGFKSRHPCIERLVLCCIETAMSYYESNNNNEQWSAQTRQPSWEHQTSSGRPGANQQLSAQQSQAAEPNAFAAQFEEIERATDNLSRSGKWYPGAAGAGQGRRDSTPTGRGVEYGDKQSRHHSNGSDFDSSRPGSAGLQNYYQGQRFPSRQSEAEQILHQKRRMAAQRERELRNYHQEQQYNRSSSSNPKPDRAMSPNTNAMSEEDRRDLIARQHRALYGDTASLYTPDGSSNRAKSQDVRGRGPSPLPYDAYGQAQPGADTVQMPPRARAESTVSPAPGLDPQPRAQTTSPGGSPPHQTGLKGVAPIGTRLPQPVTGLAKRATTPLTPSSLGYNYDSHSQSKDDRSTSVASNPAHSNDKGVSPLGGSWGTNSGVWGKANQASVWG